MGGVLGLNFYQEKKVERAPIKTGRVEDIWDKSGEDHS